MDGAKPNNIIISTGSGEILTAAVMAYCNGDKSLVTGDPSYGSPAQTAQRIKAPVKFIAVDPKSLALDLEGMIKASLGAGLVFLCNPNNPTSTVQTSADIEQTVRTIKQRSPETGILIDEAYLEYATKPGAFTMAKLALELPGVFVSRTFSKAYGMAGMRLGYAIGQPDTDEKSRQRVGPRQHQRAAGGGRHRGAGRQGAHAVGEEARTSACATGRRRSSARWASRRRSRTPTSSSSTSAAPPSSSATRCRALGVAVGRDFPPMEKSYARISLGRMEDMEKAMPFFKQVLGKTCSRDRSRRLPLAAGGRSRRASTRRERT